ncbi:MAG: hypothetical protein ABR915_21330 [Thermoguttaceae bacterium]|jgi:hypothetical protein
MKLPSRFCGHKSRSRKDNEAGSTIDAFRNSPKLMAGHLRRMLRGEGPLPVVNGIVPWMPRKR